MLPCGPDGQRALPVGLRTLLLLRHQLLLLAAGARRGLLAARRCQPWLAATSRCRCRSAAMCLLLPLCADGQSAPPVGLRPLPLRMCEG